MLLLRTEVKLFVREPFSALLVFLLPVAILVIFGSIPGAGRASADYGGHSALDTVLPSVSLALTVGMLGLFTLPTTVVGYREKGILRRLATTPLPPARLLGTQLVVHVLMAAVSGGIVLVVGAAALGMHLPARPGWLLLAFGLGTAALLAIGLVITAVASTAKTATGLGFLSYYPLAFLAGILVPREHLPHLVRVVGDWTPLGAFRMAVQAAWVGDTPSIAGLAIMAGYAVGCGALAAKFFRWE